MKSFYFLITFLLLSFPAQNTKAQLLETIILGSFKTYYGDFGRSRPRAHNIRVATRRLASVVIEPGQQFSFNTFIGERSEAVGYRRAPVITARRIRSGLGGGVCQVVSTIYAAALYSGLSIIERHPHTRVSSYVRPGLDASVNWGTKDLIIKNPFHYPVTLIASISPGRRAMEESVNIIFEAEERTYNTRITFAQQILSGFDTLEVADTNLAFEERVVVEHGTSKIRAMVHRTFFLHSGNEIENVEHIVSIYDASARIVHVGPLRNY